jgi:hypothetical protein
MPIPRSWLWLPLLGLLVASPASLAGAEPTLTVYKSPTCGCCVKWIDHLEANGFSVKAVDVPDTAAIKHEHGVPAGLGACHTAIVDGYLIEGHVPASDVARLLRERPALKGLAVPGMPIGSPGMEGPGARGYVVLGFDDEGRTQVYSRHAP